MIQEIKNHAVLSQYVADSCCENGVCVSFDEGISADSYAIVKVDKFYNSLNINRPPSLDCLIVRKCVNTGYGLTLVELKNIFNADGFEVKNMRAKFETTLYDFIKIRFSNPLDVDYKDIKLFFVSNQEIYRRDLGLKMEILMETRFKYNNKTLMITPKMPNPAIKKCY